MNKVAINEVDVLRFFEAEPIEKASVLFNIVADKMRGRLQTEDQGSSVADTKRRRRHASAAAPADFGSEQGTTA